ncbi:MAG: tellurite resistance TerB family protein [SAR324 cluster bacterium]|nr:tellurite resistance TerB family protein [SAR324 cluster bacterium]
MELFDKSTLTTVIFLAALMSAVDGDIDEEEWHVIKQFIKLHWIKQFGEFKTVQTQIASHVKKLVHNPATLKKKVNQLVGILKPKLSMKQKEVLLNLVREVMMADREVDAQEEKLIEQLMQIMEVRGK